VAATAPGFGNRFVQDDLPLILRNERVHTLARPAALFTTPYWHDPFPPALYRPLTTTALALQWKAGGGSPAIYRWVSAALLAGAAIALFHLAVLVLPLAAAAAVSLLFVVHPVHVEATALGVNQAELAAGLLLCWATAVYLRERRAGGLRFAPAATIVLLYLAAGLFKESGLVLPGLLFVAELTIPRGPAPAGRRPVRLSPFYLVLGLVFVLVFAARTAVLGGDLAGTFAAPAMSNSGLGGRALTMLGVVPHWARLLVWPASLQADYGPNEIAAAAGWGVAQAAGLAILVLLAGTALIMRHRLPSLTFGICWIAVALVPVSNLLIPTGITLAERTLFLASAGAALALGALLSLLWRTAPGPTPHLVRWGVGLGVGLLLVLGANRSRSRALVWQDQRTLLHQTILDAPKSYAARLALVRFLEDSGSTSVAASHYREATRLNPAQLAQDRVLGEQYRAAGYCQPAVRLYRRVLSVVPEDSQVRGSLANCLVRLGDTVLPRPRR
jgi:hypothetical protein